MRAKIKLLIQYLCGTIYLRGSSHENSEMWLIVAGKRKGGAYYFWPMGNGLTSLVCGDSQSFGDSGLRSSEREKPGTSIGELKVFTELRNQQRGGTAAWFFAVI